MRNATFRLLLLGIMPTDHFWPAPANAKEPGSTCGGNDYFQAVVLL